MTGNARPLQGGFPAHLDVPAWFHARVREVVAPYADDVAGGRWTTVEGAVRPDVMAEIEHVQLRQSGAPPRVPAMLTAGWAVGIMAAAIAVGVVRDGVLVHPGDEELELLQIGGGYCGDIRIADVPVSVAAGHPWAGRDGVRAVGGHDRLETAAIATIVGLGAGAVAQLGERAKLGHPGLWAQAAETVAAALLRLAGSEPVAPVQLQEATRRFLTRPGRPWKRTPEVWVAEDGDAAVLIQHRGSCCLFYQCDPDLADAPPVRPDAGYVARFGDDAPRYCGNCLFREREDVEARTVFEATRRTG